MVLDLTGSSFNVSNFGYAQQNAGHVMETQAKAILYVFKPYANQFGDVGLRPFQYMFDQNFVDETVELTDLSKRGEARASSLIAQLRTRTDLNEKMMPTWSTTGILRTSQLSDRHRFILILTDTADSLIHSGTIVAGRPNGQIRRIYTGYFEDEPFNRLDLGGSRKTLNPHAYMVITHKTVVGMTVTHDRFGSRSSLNMTSSEEIVHPQVSKAYMGNNDIHLMTPDNCVNSFEMGENNTSVSMPGAYSDLSRDTGAHVVADLFEQPAHNVAHVVKGLMHYQDEVSNRKRLAMHRNDTFFDDTFLDESMNRLQLANHLGLRRAPLAHPIFDLDIDSKISPVDLDRMVNGQLDVQDFDLERPQYYETANQMEVSVTNQYSFLIASVISPILNSAGLNSMQFVYEAAYRHGQFVDDFRTEGAEPTAIIPHSDVLQIAKAVEVELVNGIFRTIFASKGDFQVAVSANVTGMTIVRLNLVGQGYRSTADFELPSCMGGLISPLLGDSRTNAGNSEAIEQLYNGITGTPNIADTFNDDDKQFLNLANNFVDTRQTPPLKAPVLNGLEYY